VAVLVPWWLPDPKALCLTPDQTIEVLKIVGERAAISEHLVRGTGENSLHTLIKAHYRMPTEAARRTADELIKDGYVAVACLHAGNKKFGLVRTAKTYVPEVETVT